MTDDLAIKALPGVDTLRTFFRRVRDGNFVVFGAGAGASPQAQQNKEAREVQREAQLKVDAYRETYNSNVNALAERLANKEITPREFRALMLNEIRYLILTGTAAGAGGIGQLTPEDLNRIDVRVKEQAGFLDRWVADLERKETISAAQAALRARMYGGSGTIAAQESVDKARFKEFPDLPFYPAQETDCYNNCACGWDWDILDAEKGDADVYWRLNWIRDVTEHCETCQRRAKAFFPLKIRGFQFVNMPANLDYYKRD